MNYITKEKGYNFWIEREILFRDIDALGHMNNVTAIYYYEDVRVAYYKKLAEMLKTDHDNTILARVECDYLGQAFMGETVIVAMKVCRLGKKSVTYEHLISEKESSRIICTGKSVSVCYEYANQQTCVVPQHFLLGLQKMEKRELIFQDQ